ncbi:MAG: hypothetical protein KDI55_23755, partial [Anaerolineae bacterium]|nr:hypothetical protein [Anaerolineae bacterium]
MLRNIFSTSRIVMMFLGLGLITALTALSPVMVSGIQTAESQPTTSSDALVGLEPTAEPDPATYSTAQPPDYLQEVITGTEVFSMPFTAEDEPVLPPMTGPAADNRGTDFWLGFPGNHDLSSSLSLFITGDQNTSGSVVIPGLNFSYQFQLQAGQLIRVNLPRNAQTNASDRVEYLGVHVTTQQEVTVYALNQLQYSTDAYLALPKDILGREYISLSYPVTTWGGFFLGGSRFMVVA